MRKFNNKQSTTMKKVILSALSVSFMVLGLTTSCEQQQVASPETTTKEEIAQNQWNPNVRATAAAVFCQCVKYVKNKTGVQNPVAAKDYGTNLKAAGYYEVTPDFSSSWGNIWATDVIVVSNTYGSGVNATYGHVGFPSALSLVQTKDKNGKVISQYFTVKIKGSNQTNDASKVFTDAGCNNVDTNMSVKYYAGSSTLKFYRK